MAVLFKERETMTFYLPIVKYEDSSGDQKDGYEGSSQTEGRQFRYNDTGLSIYEKKLYLNPQNITNTNRKLIQKNLTKGGYFVQYWGEDLTTLGISGTTGSAGISEINKLMSIYRHEQIHFAHLAKNKSKDFINNLQNNIMLTNDPSSTFVNSGNPTTDALTFFDNLLLGGQVSQAIDGVSSVMDTISSMTSYSDKTETQYREVIKEQTMATLATSLLMSFQGVYYRGYIDNFTFTEQASEPGIFSYSFNFTVLYSSGKRENFMPWHINSEVEGESFSASMPVDGTDTDNYTFPKSESTPLQSSTISPQLSVGILEENEDGILDDPDFTVNSQAFRNNFR